MLHTIEKNGVRTVAGYRDGTWEETDPVKRGVEVPLTRGGSATSFPFAGCSPFFRALPEDLAALPPVEIQFTPFPSQLSELFRKHAARILDGEMDAKAATESCFSTIERDPGGWLTLAEDYVPLPKMWVRAVGTREGRPARYSCWFTAPMWNVNIYYLTSVALAGAVRQVLRGDVREPGISSAEKALDPDPFFDEVTDLLADSLPAGEMLDDCIEWLDT